MKFEPCFYCLYKLLGLTHLSYFQFPLTNFAIMLFHYDGNVDRWKELEWSNYAIHVSAINQTKWY